MSSPQKRVYQGRTKAIAKRERGSGRQAAIWWDADCSSASCQHVTVFGKDDVQRLPNTPQIHCEGKRKAQLVDNKRCFDIVYAGNVTCAHILAQQKLSETHGILHTHPSLELIQERPVDG